MSEYKRAIQVSVDDPICSATALNGVVIGILFEKKGSEIKEAIAARLEAIGSKVSDCRALVTPVSDFIRKKEKEIEVLDEVYQDRVRAKAAKMAPFLRRIEGVQREISDTAIEFDTETEKLIASQAVIFEGGFEDAEDPLDKVDKYLEEIKWRHNSTSTSTSSCSSTSAISGFEGPQGDPGALGFRGVQGNKEDSGDAGIFTLTEEEDRAVSRIGALRSKVRAHSGRVQHILNLLRDLEGEGRRLKLIQGHINDERVYKLDLNKLSAFGFEDIEIV